MRNDILGNHTEINKMKKITSIIKYFMLLSNHTKEIKQLKINYRKRCLHMYTVEEFHSLKRFGTEALYNTYK